MIDDEHKLENFIELLGFIAILLALEERDEHIIFPIIVKSILFLVNFINFENGGGLERPQSTFHEGKELFFHLWGEVLITDFVVLQEELLKLAGKEVIEHLLYLCIHLFPEILIIVLKFLHEVVHIQIILPFDAEEVSID